MPPPLSVATLFSAKPHASRSRSQSALASHRLDGSALGEGMDWIIRKMPSTLTHNVRCAHPEVSSQRVCTIYTHPLRKLRSPRRIFRDFHPIKKRQAVFHNPRPPLIRRKTCPGIIRVDDEPYLSRTQRPVRIHGIASARFRQETKGLPVFFQYPRPEILPIMRRTYHPTWDKWCPRWGRKK